MDNKNNTTIVSASTVADTLKNMLENCKSLTPKFIKDNNLSKKEIEDYNKSLKEKKMAKKLSAIQLEKCAIVYKGQMVSFKPSLVNTEKGSKLVMWKNLDKNAIYYACKGDDGSVAYNAIACVSKNSSVYNFRAKEVKNNEKEVRPIFKEVFEGLSWDAFYARVSGYKNIKTVNCPTVLKSL